MNRCQPCHHAVRPCRSKPYESIVNLATPWMLVYLTAARSCTMLAATSPNSAPSNDNLQCTTDEEATTNASYILLSCLAVSLDHRSLIGAQCVAGDSEARNAWGIMGCLLDLTVAYFVPKGTLTGTLTALRAPLEGYIFMLQFLL
jgi:hypothetical protein